MAAHVAGNQAAFRALFERYVGPLTRLMSRNFGSREEVQDLVQQTFFQLHRARYDYDCGQPLRPWLYTIALNLRRQFHRERKRRPVLGADPRALEQLGVPPYDAVQTDVRRQLQRSLALLPSDQRDIIELHWFDGLSFSEIATCVGITANAAKVRAHRGYLKLRIALDAAEKSSNRALWARIDIDRKAHGLR
jgi:RNA polymerase sigma-70 factor (ECF subfamily)